MYSPKDRYLWIREALSLNMVLEIPFAMRSSGMYLPGIVFLTILFFFLLISDIHCFLNKKSECH